MADIKKISNGGRGKTFYNAGIVRGIVSIAVSEVPGVAISSKSKKTSKFADAIKLKFNDDGICVDVNINVFAGYNVPDIAFNIQQSIKESVESMSEYKIDSINVHVVSVVASESEVDE